MVSGKIVFFGSPPFVIPYLEALRKNFQLMAIVTGPDRRGGRNKRPIPHPVKDYASDNGIKCFQPERLEDCFLKELLSVQADLGVVIAYGRLIPQKIINYFPFKIINLHFSLLPSYRGAAPLQTAIINGESRSGFTIFELVSKLDAGPIIFQKELPLPEDLTFPQILDLYINQSIDPLISTIDLILQKKAQKLAQQENLVSYAPAIKKEQGLIDFKNSADRIFNYWRAFQPWPEIYFYHQNKKIILKQIKLIAGKTAELPGKIICLTPSEMVVACGNQTMLGIISLKPEGKKEMTPYQYDLGNKLGEAIC